MRHARKLLKTKIFNRNLFPKEINILGYLNCRILGTVLEIDVGRTLKIDLRTRKVTTMHKVLQLRDDIDRLYVSRKEGERELASIADSVAGLI